MSVNGDSPQPFPTRLSDKLHHMALSSRAKRRVRTFPTTVVIWLMLTLLLPVVVLIAATVDLLRWVATRKPWITTRLVGIGWVYVSAQVVVITVAPVHWLLSLGFGRGGKDRLKNWTYGLQRWWVRLLMSAMQVLLGLRLEVEGTVELTPGPIILLFRHASIMDNLLPYALVSDPTGLQLRWVLKRELLSDPALDIGGHRTPNYFVDRSSDNPETERKKIAELGADLLSHEGLMLFPEGTRYSKDRFRSRMERLKSAQPNLYKIMKGHDLVLPPRSGGVVALLDTGMDVVFGAHSGLEELRGVGDIWRNAAVNKTVRVEFRRVQSKSIPTGTEARIEWLHREWAAVDDTIRSMTSRL